MLPIDLVRERLDLRNVVAIPAEVGAAGRAQLDERDAPAVMRIFFQEALDGAETFGQALGIIDALHSHGNVKVFEFVLALELCDAAFQLLRRSREPLRPRLHADRKRAHERALPAQLYSKV